MTEMNEHLDAPDDEPGVRPSRRTVLKVAAWTVPAVIVTQAAPALAAASPIPVEIVLDGDNACKFPGNSNSIPKGYAFSLTATNPSTTCVARVTVTALTLNGAPLNITALAVVTQAGTVSCVTDAAAPFQFDIPAMSVRQVALFTEDFGSSPSQTLQLTYDVAFVSCAGGATPPDGAMNQKASASLTGGAPWNSGCRPFEISPTLWDASNCPKP